METTSATCEFCDTYSTLFFAIYFALVAVIVSDAFAGQWTRKAKTTPPQPSAPQPAQDSEAGGKRTENKPGADRAITQEDK